MNYKELPPARYMNYLLEYNSETGELFWKVRKACNIRPGQTTGRQGSAGYGTVRIDNQNYKVHRVIWKMVTGEDPGNKKVDHRDRDPSNNKWDNLRISTSSQNGINSGIFSTNTSGYKGVSRHKKSWRVSIWKDGKRYGKAGYKSLGEAALAYNSLALELHGEFAYLNPV